MNGGRSTGVRLAAAGLAAAVVLSGCTPKQPPAPDSTAAPTPSVSFEAGADGIGDSLYPKAGNGGYDVANYDLDVRYNPASQVLTGTAVITALTTANLNQFDLDLHGLQISSLTVDGQPAKYDRAGDELVVVPLTPLPTGQKFAVTVQYAGVPQAYSEPDLGTDGFLAANGGAIAIGEPEVAASWYPVNDHPRDKATYTIKITAPDGLDSLSNGVLKDKQSVGGQTTTTWTVSTPMASYLATMVVGHYRVKQSTHNGKPVITAVASSLGTFIDTQLDRTPEVIDFLETQFGPYPFDSMGGIVIDDKRVRFALENQTRPIYADAFFHAGGDSSWVIAHELAHQWYGDSVSVDQWKDIWLNEGFATYAEWLWNEKNHVLTVQQTFDRMFTATNTALWSVPPGDPTKEQVFGNSVYDRGAMTLQALRIKVGDTAFFTIIKDWAKQKASGNGNTAEFIALAEKDSGKDLKALFDAWLFGTVQPPRPA